MFGGVWIGSTAWLVLHLARTQSQYLWLQSLKGWAFVVISGMLVFGLVSVREAQLQRTTQRLQTAGEQLQVIHRVFRHNLRNELTVIQGDVGNVKATLDHDELVRQRTTAEAAADLLMAVSQTGFLTKLR